MAELELFKHYFQTVLEKLNLYDSQMIFFDAKVILRVYEAREWKDPSRSREVLHLFFQMICVCAGQLSIGWWWYMCERLKCLMFLDQWLLNEKISREEKKDLQDFDTFHHVPSFISFISTSVALLEREEPPLKQMDKPMEKQNGQNLNSFQRHVKTIQDVRDTDLRIGGFSKYYIVKKE